MGLSPRLVDWVLNGVPVYIRRRPADGKAYATIYDYSRFLPNEAPLETVRIRVTKDTPATWDPTEEPVILKKLAEYNRGR